MENTIKIQILKLIQLKTIISEVKNILDDINGRLDVVGERSMSSKAQQQKLCKMKQKNKNKRKKKKSLSELLGNFQGPNMYVIRVSEVEWGQKIHLKK